MSMKQWVAKTLVNTGKKKVGDNILGYKGDGDDDKDYLAYRDDYVIKGASNLTTVGGEEGRDARNKQRAAYESQVLDYQTWRRNRHTDAQIAQADAAKSAPTPAPAADEETTKGGTDGDPKVSFDEGGLRRKKKGAGSTRGLGSGIAIPS